MPEELGQVNTNTVITLDGDIISCWTASENGNTVAGDWLKRIQGSDTDTAPFVAVRDMTIIALGCTSRDPDTWSIGIYADSGSGAVLIHTIQSLISTNQIWESILSIDINEGDRISMRQDTGSTNDPTCDLYLKSR